MKLFNTVAEHHNQGTNRIRAVIEFGLFFCFFFGEAKKKGENNQMTVNVATMFFNSFTRSSSANSLGYST